VLTLDEGDPIVENESNIASNLTVDTQSNSGTTNGNIIYGISAPDFEPDYMVDAAAGKFYLWKYDDTFPARIELADFSGMTVWQAISSLAQIIDYIIGFTPSGDFYMVPRITSVSTPDYIFKNDPEDSRVIQISKNYGWKEIYNYASISPSKTQMQEPQGEIILKKRPESFYYVEENGARVPVDQPPFINMVIDQRDLLSKRLHLRCVRSGEIGTSLPPYFGWLIYEGSIENYIAAPVASDDTVIRLGSVFGGEASTDGVKIDDYLAVVDPDDEEIEIVRRITAVNASTDQVTIESAFGKAFTSGTPAKILRRYTTQGGAVKWSDEGVTKVYSADGSGTSFEVYNCREIAIGNWIKVAKDPSDFGNPFQGSEASVVAVEEDANNPPRGTVYVDRSIAWEQNDNVYAYLRLEQTDTFYEIGGTSVFLKFVMLTGSDLTRNVDYTKQFLVGDTITINCPAMKITTDSSSTKVCYSSSSIADYGKRKFTPVVNKFMTSKLARRKVYSVVSDYKDPHYLITVDTIFLPWLDMVDISTDIDYGAELVENNDCEDALPTMNGARSTGHCSSELSTDYAYGGSKSVKLTETDTPTPSTYMYYNMGNTSNLGGCIPGEEYEFSAYVYMPSAGGATGARLRIIDYINNSGSGSESVVSDATTTQDAWVKLTARKRIRANATGVHFRVHFTGPDTGGYVGYFDSLTVKRVRMKTTGSLRVVGVKDKRLFPLTHLYSEPNTVACYIRKVIHDPANCRSRYVLRSIEPY